MVVSGSSAARRAGERAELLQVRGCAPPRSPRRSRRAASRVCVPGDGPRGEVGQDRRQPRRRLGVAARPACVIEKAGSVKIDVAMIASRRSRHLRAGRAPRGEVELKRRAAAGRVAHADVAAVVAHDLAHERQAQAGAFLARGEERREDLLAQRRSERRGRSRSLRCEPYHRRAAVPPGSPAARSPAALGALRAAATALRARFSSARRSWPASARTVTVGGGRVDRDRRSARRAVAHQLADLVEQRAQRRRRRARAAGRRA